MPVGAGLHPIAIVPEPGLYFLLIAGRPRRWSRRVQEPDTVEHVKKPIAFDDSGAAALVNALDKLSTLQIGIHTRGRIQEPNTNQQCCTVAIAAIAGNITRQRKLIDVFGHLSKRSGVVAIGLRIALTVSANVWQSIRRVRI